MNEVKLGFLALTIAAVATIGILAYRGVDNTGSNAAQTSENTDQTLVKASPLDLEFTNLTPLEEGTYEAWLIKGVDKFSIGRFNTDIDSNIVGTIDLENLTPSNGDTIAITIEPLPDDDRSSSNTIILEGVITDGSAELSFPTDTSEFKGKYILGTPTTTTKTDETSGIWFTSTGNDALLDLPDAPTGWVYEGWVVYEGNPISSGKFRGIAGADSFSGYSGTDKDGPKYPGEDFIVNLPFGIVGPIDLANGSSRIVISLEPDTAGVDPTGAGPSQIKPLFADILLGAKDHVIYGLNIDNSTSPSGKATLK